MTQNLQYRFPRQEFYTTSYLSFEDLGEGPEAAGIYSWHLRLRPNATFDQIKALAGVLARENYNLNATGNLRQSFSGNITRQIYPPVNADVDVFRRALMLAEPILYIGMSRNLRARLMAHKKWIEDSTYKRVSRDGDSKVTEEPDTYEESRNFGMRIAAALQQSGLNDLRCLYVKYICIEQEDLQEQNVDLDSAIKAVEFNCNSLIHPLFGRR